MTRAGEAPTAVSLAHFLHADRRWPASFDRVVFSDASGGKEDRPTYTFQSLRDLIDTSEECEGSSILAIHYGMEGTGVRYGLDMSCVSFAALFPASAVV